MGVTAKLLMLLQFAAADVAGGLFIANATTLVFGVHPLWWHYLLGVFFAVLPDLDIPLQMAVEGRMRCDHRKYLHHPLIALLVAVAVWPIAGGFWAVLWAGCLLWHFVHDSLGWHLVWWAPLSSKGYQFSVKREGRLHPVYVMSQEEMAERNNLPVSDNFSGKIAIPWSQLFVGLGLCVVAILLALLRQR